MPGIERKEQQNKPDDHYEKTRRCLFFARGETSSKCGKAAGEAQKIRGNPGLTTRISVGIAASCCRSEFISRNILGSELERRLKPVTA
jgi:hypothetical protein